MDRKYTERVELHCHSVYSQEDGVSTVKDIIDFADDNGMSAVAITDYASVSGYGEATYYARQHSGRARGKRNVPITEKMQHTNESRGGVEYDLYYWRYTRRIW